MRRWVGVDAYLPSETAITADRILGIRKIVRQVSAAPEAVSVEEVIETCSGMLVVVTMKHLTGCKEL